jgi:hypothetical protein
MRSAVKEFQHGRSKFSSRFVMLACLLADIAAFPVLPSIRGRKTALPDFIRQAAPVHGHFPQTPLQSQNEQAGFL